MMFVEHYFVNGGVAHPGLLLCWLSLLALIQMSDYSVSNATTLISPSCLRLEAMYADTSDKFGLTCEGKYGGLFRGHIGPRDCYLPELGSTVTALFVFWCGAHMLAFWRTEVHTLLITGASFAVNGWASFVSHATAWPIASTVDRWSMTLTAWLIVAFMGDETAEAL